MRAVVQDVYGPAEVLRLEEVDRPVVGPGEVLVRVRAAGVDRGVWHLMTGLPYLVRLAGFGLLRPKHRVRGMDVSGCVEAVGPGVTRFRLGDEVLGTCDGAFAEFAATREARLVAKPARLSFEQAAAVSTTGLTALQGLRDVARARAGQEVLIIGAAGGVGSYAVQIAKALGTEVTGVCSTAKVDLVRSLGADATIDYTREDFADGRHRWDVVLDTAGNRPLNKLRRALAPRGTLVIVGGEGGGRWLGGTDRQLRALALSPFVMHSLRSFVATVRQEDLEALVTLIEEGRVTPHLDRTYPLERAADAIRYLTEGHAAGKVVLTV